MLPEDERPPRKMVKHYDSGEPHFLTFSCYRRLPLLSKDRTRRWFVEALDEARIAHGFHLWACHHARARPSSAVAAIQSNCVRSPFDARSLRGILSSIKRPVGEKTIAYLSEQAPNYLRRLTVTNATPLLAGGFRPRRERVRADRLARFGRIRSTQSGTSRIGVTSRRLGVVDRPRLDGGV